MNSVVRAIEIQSIATSKSLVLRRSSYKGSLNDWRDSNSCGDLLSTIATKFHGHANAVDIIGLQRLCEDCENPTHGKWLDRSSPAYNRRRLERFFEYHP